MNLIGKRRQRKNQSHNMAFRETQTLIIQKIIQTKGLGIEAGIKVMLNNLIYADDRVILVSSLPKLQMLLEKINEAPNTNITTDGIQIKVKTFIYLGTTVNNTLDSQHEIK